MRRDERTPSWIIFGDLRRAQNQQARHGHRHHDVKWAQAAWPLLHFIQWEARICCTYPHLPPACSLVPPAAYADIGRIVDRRRQERQDDGRQARRQRPKVRVEIESPNPALPNPGSQIPLQKKISPTPPMPSPRPSESAPWPEHSAPWPVWGVDSS